MYKNYKYLFLVLAIIGLIGGSVVVLNNQNINRGASELEDTGKIIIQPVSNNSQTVSAIEVDFETGSQDDMPTKISAISFRITFPGDLSSDLLDVSQPFSSSEMFQSDGWIIAVNRSEVKDDTTYLDFAAVYKGDGGYSTITRQNLTTVEFKEETFTVDEYNMLGWKDELVKMMTNSEPVQDIVGSINKNNL